MKRILPILKLLFGWPLSFLALFFIYKTIASKTDLVLPNIKDINLQVLIYSVFCFLLYFGIRSYFWKNVLKIKGNDIPLKESTFLWMSSELKRFIPGNIWSFLGRTTLFSSRGVPTKNIVTSLIIEAQFFLFACLILSSISISFIFYNFFSYLPNIKLLISLTIGILTLVSLFFVLNGKLSENIKLPKILNRLFTDFSARQNIELLLISIIYMFFFSLGTYFSIASIMFLTPIHIATFIGLFAFSMFIGYVSIIMPMGLGIREGVMTFGLAKFVALNVAGFASIFTRIIMVLSELLFFALSFIWMKTKNKFVLRIEEIIRKHPVETILLILISVYILYFTNLTFLKYDNFYTGRFDLGNMDQTVWNTSRGRIFQTTDPNGTQIISRLAFHADFILVLLAPLYLLWSDPKMLLLLQTVILAFGAIFIFKIAKHVTENKILALVFSFAYLINPSVNYTNFYDFHAVTLATTFLLGCIYFFFKGKRLLFLLFALLAALTKEQVWIIVSLFGFVLTFENIFSFVKTKRIKINSFVYGLLLFIIPLFIFYFLVWIAIPTTHGQNHFALTYYSDFGATPTSIVKNIIFNPFKTFSIIFQNGRLAYLWQLFSPLGLLSFVSPLFLIFTLPDLIINLLSNNSQLHQIYYQYSATITPFIFIAAIYATKDIKKLFSKINDNILILYLLFASLFSAYYFGPIIGSKYASLDMLIFPQTNADVIQSFIERIPPKYSIAATNNIGSHLSHRQKIYTIPIGIDQADIVVFLLNDKFAQPSLAAQIEIANKMKKDKNYIEIFKEGDFIVFEKRNLYIQLPPKTNKVKLSPISIPTLQHRDYIEGDIIIENSVLINKNYDEFLISYSSDGLKLYGLMTIPKSPKPEKGYPVVIVNHGYINPKDYSTTNSYKNIVSYFASRGYLVLKPDYRGNANSEVDNEALMRFSYPIDVLNLITSINTIRDANPNKIYLWGHSMGGEVTLKVLEILGRDKNLEKSVRAAVVWAPVIDDKRWFSKQNLPLLEESINQTNPYNETFKILGTPEKNPVLWQSLSPINYIADINIPIQINQGAQDQTIPYEWSIELYDDLISLSKFAKLVVYPDADHNLSQVQSSALENNIQFFNKFK